MKSECVLAALAGSHDCERLVVVLVQTPAGSSRISLRQQHWAEGIGWYDQKSLDLEPDQLRQLRGVLGGRWSRSPQVRHEEAPAILPFPGTVRVESA